MLIHYYAHTLLSVIMNYYEGKTTIPLTPVLYNAFLSVGQCGPINGDKYTLLEKLEVQKCLCLPLVCFLPNLLLSQMLPWLDWPLWFSVWVSSSEWSTMDTHTSGCGPYPLVWHPNPPSHYSSHYLLYLQFLIQVTLIKENKNMVCCSLSDGQSCTLILQQ